MTESPQDFASATAEKIAEGFSGAKDAAKDAKEKGASFAEQVSESLKAGAETQKSAGAEAIASFARSARDAAKELDQASPQIARLMRTSADTVEQMGNDLRGKSLAELAASLDRFAAQRPLAFIGGGLLAGIAISRLFSTPKK